MQIDDIYIDRLHYSLDGKLDIVHIVEIFTKKMWGYLDMEDIEFVKYKHKYSGFHSTLPTITFNERFVDPVTLRDEKLMSILSGL